MSEAAGHRPPPHDGAWRPSADDLWAGFEEHALAPGTPEAQRDEMRKAFVSGLWTAFNIFLTVPEEPSDADDLWFLDLVDDLGQRAGLPG